MVRDVEAEFEGSKSTAFHSPFTCLRDTAVSMFYFFNRKGILNALSRIVSSSNVFPVMGHSRYARIFLKLRYVVIRVVTGEGGRGGGNEEAAIRVGRRRECGQGKK